MTIPFEQWPSPQKIAHCLRGYLMSIKHWAPNMAETAKDLGYREHLHDLIAEMTPAQYGEMARLDARAAVLYAQHRGQPDPYFDIRALGDMVAIAESERQLKAA